eukprot:TRINITY_DN4_c0_g1_i2.p1 TRINITY_DN4_c0_g1~~TRINITY_DN4_c0_g1_i2.p1  ORF type:complete len:635 (+),score=26.79 TRINITY_DN4_c0_g1_i2:165-1907(+)
MGLPPSLAPTAVEQLRNAGFCKLELLCKATKEQIERIQLLPGAETACFATIDHQATPDAPRRSLSAVPIGRLIKVRAGEQFKLKLFSVVGGCPPYKFTWTKNYTHEINCDSSLYDKGCAADYDDSGYYVVSVKDTKESMLVNEFYVQVVQPMTLTEELLPWQRIACHLSEHELAFTIDHETLKATFPLNRAFGSSSEAVLPFSFPKGFIYLWDENDASHMITLEEPTFTLVLKTRWCLLRGEFDKLDTAVMEEFLDHSEGKGNYIAGNRLDILEKMKARHECKLSDYRKQTSLHARSKLRPAAQGLFVRNRYMPGVASLNVREHAVDFATSDESSLTTNVYAERRQVLTELSSCRGAGIAGTRVAGSVQPAHSGNFGVDKQLTMTSSPPKDMCPEMTALSHDLAQSGLSNMAAIVVGIEEIISNLIGPLPSAAFTSLGVTAIFSVVYYARGKHTLTIRALAVAAAACTSACVLIGAEAGAAVGTLAGPIGALVGYVAGGLFSYLAALYLGTRFMERLRYAESQRKWARKVIGVSKKESMEVIKKRAKILAYITAPDKGGDGTIYSKFLQARGVLVDNVYF